MPNIATKEQLLLLVALLLPGFIIATIRNVFVVQRNQSGYQEILAYIFGSTISHVVGAPLWAEIINGQLGFWGQYGCLTVLLVVIPVLIGMLWSYAIQCELVERFSPKIGLYAVHHVHTAWDWKFSRVRSYEWVLVTLKDGTQHAGYIGANSFIASGSTDRDLYIEQVYDLDIENKWAHPGRRKSILIPYAEVRTIVFWPDNMEANADVTEDGD
jgi:Family of unknown function (DUF6338)